MPCPRWYWSNQSYCQGEKGGYVPHKVCSRSQNRTQKRASAHALSHSHANSGTLICPSCLSRYGGCLLQPQVAAAARGWQCVPAVHLGGQPAPCPHHLGEGWFARNQGHSDTGIAPVRSLRQSWVPWQILGPLHLIGTPKHPPISKIYQGWSLFLAPGTNPSLIINTLLFIL